MLSLILQLQTSQKNPPVSESVDDFPTVFSNLNFLFLGCSGFRFPFVSVLLSSSAVANLAKYSLSQTLLPCALI